MDRSRKKYEAQFAQGDLGAWNEFWHPPRVLKVKDVFPHLTIDDNGTLRVRGLLVDDNVIKEHWRLFHDLIEEDDLPRVYERYKKAIDARTRDPE